VTVFGNTVKNVEDRNKDSPPEKDNIGFPESPEMNSVEILLLDFEDKDYKELKDKKFEVALKQTNWKSSSIESLIIPENCKMILYQANSNSTISSAHARDSEKFKTLIAKGGVMACFVGQCETFHLTNFSGPIPKLEFKNNDVPNITNTTKKGPFAPLFKKFSNSIIQAKKLFPEAMAIETKIDLRAWDPNGFGEMEVLATSSDGYPISAVIRDGKGYYLLLPWFGEKNIKVAEMISKEMLPQSEIQGESGDELAWLDSEEYAFPGLQELYKEKEEARKKFEQVISKIDKKIEDLKEKKQAPFQKMLITEGTELKKSVITALEYIGWKKVVDVDDYWKNVVRDKEEDIWLLEEDSAPIETTIKTGYVFLVNTVGSDKDAVDDDCAVLQKFKGRRMQEFNNTKMKAILIGNYFNKQDAKQRKNPYSEVQIADAEKDANGLMTTYELFKAVKAVMENKIKKEDIQRQMEAQLGLIKFNIK
jgi:hypothetical protein